jgi:hypothetical protein
LFGHKSSALRIQPAVSSESEIFFFKSARGPMGRHGRICVIDEKVNLHGLTILYITHYGKTVRSPFVVSPFQRMYSSETVHHLEGLHNNPYGHQYCASHEQNQDQILSVQLLPFVAPRFHRS